MSSTDTGDTGSDLAGFPVEMSVLAWCLCGGPDTQLQVKVKPSLVNRSDQDVPIEVANFWLVVTDEDAQEWSGRTSGAVPLPVQDDQEGPVLYIPSNKDGWAQPLGDSWTFATHWDQAVLPAGGTYVDEAVKEGDMVFYAPTGADGQVHVLGLALMSNEMSQVLGWVPAQSWGLVSDPNTF